MRTDLSVDTLADLLLDEREYIDVGICHVEMRGDEVVLVNDDRGHTLRRYGKPELEAIDPEKLVDVLHAVSRMEMRKL